MNPFGIKTKKICTYIFHPLSWLYLKPTNVSVCVIFHWITKIRCWLLLKLSTGRKTALKIQNGHQERPPPTASPLPPRERPAPEDSHRAKAEDNRRRPPHPQSRAAREPRQSMLWRRRGVRQSPFASIHRRRPFFPSSATTPRRIHPSSVARTASTGMDAGGRWWWWWWLWWWWWWGGRGRRKERE